MLSEHFLSLAILYMFKKKIHQAPFLTVYWIYFRPGLFRWAKERHCDWHSSLFSYFTHQMMSYFRQLSYFLIDIGNNHQFSSLLLLLSQSSASESINLFLSQSLNQSHYPLKAINDEAMIKKNTIKHKEFKYIEKYELCVELLMRDETNLFGFKHTMLAPHKVDIVN